MEGHRTTLVAGAVLAALVAGATAAAAVPGGSPRLDLPTVSVPTVSVPTIPDVTVPTVPSDPNLPTVPTVPTLPEATPTIPVAPIDDSAPLPDLPTAGGLPAVTEGTLDATSQIVTTSTGDSAGPEVLRLVVPEAPVAGTPVSFTIAATGGDQPMSGVSFDFGEAGARFGESACRRRPLSRRATFSVPYTFAQSGPHIVRFELRSGSCGTASRVTAGQVTVNVAKGDAALRAVTGPDAGVLSTRCPNSDVLPTLTTRTKVRAATLCLLNEVRRAAGLRTLRSLRSLRRIAAQHSRDMVTRRYFDHTEPPNRTLLSRLHTIRWAGSAGENIGYGTAYYATARAMLWAWMHSTGHRVNILDGEFRWVGIAISLGAPSSNSPFGATYTTDFGGR